MLPVVTTQVVPGKSGVTLLARIVGNSNIPITQATITSVTVQTTDLTLEGNLVGSGNIATHSPTVASTVFNALQTDAIWTKDTVLQPGIDGLVGYNFKYLVPAADFANAGDQFECDVKIVPSTGEAFEIPFVFRTRKVYA